MEHHPEGILMEADTYNALVKTIQRDCRVLESFKIMDYSLLVGVHNLDQAQRDKAVRLSYRNNFFSYDIDTYFSLFYSSYVGKKVASKLIRRTRRRRFR